jgi:hypothetical protein
MSVTSFFGDIAKSVLGTPATSTNTPAPPPPVATPAPSPAPLESFTKLWEPVAAPKEPDPNKPGNIFAAASLEEMNKAAQGVNFTQGIDPAVVAKITAGGPESVDALMHVINTVGQRAYAQAAFVATQVTDQGLTRYDNGLNARLPGVIKKQTVSESVASENPAFKHPALSPVITAVEAQFQAKFPHASSAEIKEYTLNYLEQMGGLITGTKETKQTGTPVKGEQDWSIFLEPQAQR